MDAEKINAYLSNLDTRLKEMERVDKITKKVHGIKDEKQEPTKYDLKDEEAVLSAIKDMDARIQEVDSYRNPQTVWSKVQRQIDLIEEVSNQMTMIMQKMAMFDLDERFIRRFTDDEIKSLYISCGLTEGEVKTYLEKVYSKGKTLNQPQISLWVNGKTEDLMLRHLLGNLFLYESIKKNRAIA